MPRVPTPLILGMVLLSPSLLVVALYLEEYVSGRPFYRPLGITRESLDETEATLEGVTVRVKAALGQQWRDAEGRREFLKELTDALAIRTNDFTLYVEEVPGRSAQFTFTVGRSVFGPYPSSRVVDGLQEALEAHNMGLMRRSSQIGE